MPAVSEEAKQRARDRARERMAEKRKTPEFAAWRQRYMAESKEKRRLYKERLRRSAGAIPAAVIKMQAEKAREERRAHDAHVRLWRQVCSALWVAHKHRDDEAWKARQIHSAHVAAWKKARPGDAWRHRYCTDEGFNARQKTRSRIRKKTRLDRAIAGGVAATVRQGKFPKSWVQLLGYSSGELVAHLKKTVPKGRTWQDFMAGQLHIDHITPCSMFDLSKESEVRACWALGNLRLLDAAENLRKSYKREFLL